MNIINHYDGYQVFPGQYSYGDRTNTENTADLGGIKIMLEIGKNIAGFDNREFFANFAKVFYYDMTIGKYLTEDYASDSHSLGRVRTNKALMCFDEFYEAYPEIIEGDFMYNAPITRYQVW